MSTVAKLITRVKRTTLTWKAFNRIISDFALMILLREVNPNETRLFFRATNAQLRKFKGETARLRASHEIRD